MIRDKDIDAGNVVLDTGATPVLNCVHDAVDHNLGTEWVVAGHGNHTDRNFFAAGGNTLGIGTAALGAGTVMGHIDFKGVKRFAIGGTADILLEINPGRSSQNQFGVIAGGVDMDANATLRMHPFPVAALIVTGENKNMVCSAAVIQEETQITGKKLRFGNGSRACVLRPRAGLNADAKGGFVHPVGKPGAIQPIRTNRSRGT